MALPQMQADLGFSQRNLTWVFNAYVVALGGLLLLGGRLSDLFAARRMFHGWLAMAFSSVFVVSNSLRLRGFRSTAGQPTA